MALENEFTPEEQAQFDQMRAADTTPPETVEPTQEVAREETAQDSVAGAQEGQPAPDKRQQTVPHAALHEERERRKDVERRLAEAEKSRQTLEERTNLLLQRLGLAPTEDKSGTVELPDIEKDPVGHIMGQIVQQGKALETVVGALNQRNQQDQQVASIAAIQQRAVIAEREFRAATEDYDAAVAHLLESGNRELELRGVTDPAQRQALLSQEALGIAQRAIQLERNPAEMIYQLAQLRGYRKTDPAPKEETTETPAPAQRLDNARRGQEQDGRSLSTARGTGPRTLTAQSLVNMSEAEFAKAMSSPEGRALLGE